MAAQTTFEKRILSGSTTGRGISVTATATLGTTIHTATAVAGEIDEVYLWAQNIDTAAVLLTVEFGGVTTTRDLITVTIPPRSGPVAICPGWPLNGGLVVTAFAATTAVIELFGYVNRMS